MRWRMPQVYGGVRPRVRAALVVGAGVVLTAAAFASLRYADDRRVEAEFARRSTALSAGFERVLEQRLAVLAAVASFDASSAEVERDEFRTFAGSMRLDCIRALEWVPRVSAAERRAYEGAARAQGYPGFRFTERDGGGRLVAAGERAEYFPVYYLEPYAGNEAALGFDLGSDPVRRAVMERARDTGWMLASDRVGLIQDPGHQRGFLVLMPVYRRGLPHGTVAERRANLKGFELAVFRTDEIVRAWQRAVDVEGIAFALASRGEDGRDRVLHASDGWDGAADGTDEPAGRGITRSFDLAGRTWRLRFRPGAAYLAARRAGHEWVALVSGAVFVALLGALLMGSIAHTERIERSGRRLRDAMARMRLAWKEAELLDGVMQKINVGVGLGQVLDYVFESFDAVIPYDRIGCAVIDHDGRRVRSRWARSKCGVPLISPDFSVPLARSGLRSVVESGTPRIIDDLEAHLRAHPGSEATRRIVAEGMRSNLTCPLVAAGEAVGFLFLSSTRRGTYRAEHVRTFTRIANQLSLAVRKGRLYDEVGDELQASEERFALAVRGTDAGIWDWDLRTGRVYFSPRWKSMLGYGEDEVEGRVEEWKRLLHPDDRERAEGTLRAYLDGWTTAYEVEHRLRHKDGTYRWIVARGAAVYDVDGKPYRMVGSHIDVTDRKLAEDALRGTRAQLLGAQQIQEHLLPTVPPAVAGVDVAGACYPSSFTAGDYFDYLTMDDGSLVLVVADVMGHGLGPALLAATVQAYLRSVEGTSIGIEQMAASLNRLLLRSTGGGRFVTLILARFDPRALTIEFVNAGHPPGYVIDDAGALKAELGSSSLPLGVEAQTAFVVCGPIPLAHGDLLVMTTDGVVETLSPDDREFGSRRLLEFLKANRGRSAQELIVALRRTATEFSERIGLLDDLTAVVLKIDPAPWAAPGRPARARPDGQAHAGVGP